MTFDREQLIFDYALIVKDRLDDETIQSLVYANVKERFPYFNDEEIRNHMENMDINQVISIVFHTTVYNLHRYSDDDLIAEIREHNPELLENVTIEEPSTGS